MRISTNQIFQQGLTAMLNQQAELAKTQQQIATGEKLASPSDDPVAAVKILNFERESNLLNQYIANADVVTTNLAIEEDVLSGVTNALQRVRELAVQGLNDTNTASDRADIAQEIQVLNEQLLSLANTKDASGNYLFSGYSSDTQPYGSIGASYAGDEGQRNIQVGPGVLVETNDAGSSIFETELTSTVVTDNVGPSSAELVIVANGTQDPIANPVTISFANPDVLTVTDGTNTVNVSPYEADQAVSLSDLNAAFPDIDLRLEGTLADGDSYTIGTEITPQTTIFNTINSFANALLSDEVSANDAPNNGDFLTNMSTAIDNVVDTKAKIGARMNVVDQQQQISEGLAASVTETLSGLQDLDYAEAISKLSIQSTALQAAQQTFAKVQSLTLFNFL